MVEKLNASDFWAQSRAVPILDVRSPGEFIAGHIPGAISFPLFSDNERAEIGTMYKQVGKEQAMNRGMELVEPRIKKMVESALAMQVNGELLVHCWRGGKRSESTAWLLSEHGLKIGLLVGGYKSYRNWVLSQFEKPWNFIVVGGRTGSGKTHLLHALKNAGEPVLDLEYLADHKGSSFGRLGSTREVTQAQFENDLACELSAMEGKTIWLEDESRGIGRMVIPEGIWKCMRSTRVFYLDLAQSERVRLLIADYGKFSTDELGAAILRVKDQLGGLRTAQAMDALARQDLETVVTLMLEYYDKTYTHGLSKRSPETIAQIPFSIFEADEIAKAFIAKKNESLR
jgi:tRNA 2-selenouridine synthase